MKKYLNKGLLYAWFNSAKAPIAIGILVWGFIANVIIEEKLSFLRWQIADNFSNYITTENLEKYFVLGIIFIAICFIAQGINKRNTAMFLASGPYTKKQIKYNEFISLIITLIFFAITYIYIVLMAYIRNKEFLSIVEGYEIIIFIEVIKIVLFGAIGIVFMLIIDSMFSNSVIGFICMISVIPASVVLTLEKIFITFNYVGLRDNYNFLSKIDDGSSNDRIQSYTPSILLDNVSTREITINQLSLEIIITLIIISIMLIIFNIAQSRYKLESCNKIFSSKTNGNIVVILVSIALGSLASLIFMSDFINNMKLKNGEYLPLVGLDLIKGLSADILCVGIIGFIAYKIIKKILSTVS